MNSIRFKIGVIIIEGHVQGLANTRALGEAGIPVYVADTGKCVAQYSKYCKRFFKCPDYNSNEFADFLVNIAEKNNLKDWVLLPSNDHAVYTISKHKSRLEKFFKFTIQELAIVEKIYNKAALLDIAKQCNVPIPKTQDNAKEYSGQILKFPVLTRGKEGKSFYHASGKKAFLALNENDLKSQLKYISSKIDLSKTITQELLPFDGTNKTVSFTAFCINGEIKSYWMGVKLREHPLQFGTATLTESVFIKECLEQSERLLQKLTYTGVCEVEYLQDPRDKKFKLIEINPRTWLWVGQAIACGINYPVLAYNFLNQIKNVYPSNYEIGIKWYNPYTDFFFGLKAIAKRKLTIKDYLTMKRGNRVSALGDRNDPKPFFVYGVLMFRMLSNR